MKASELLKSLEDHCGEELKCSRRLRHQIIESVQRIIDREANLRSNIESLIKNQANSTFDTNEYSLRRRNNTK